MHTTTLTVTVQSEVPQDPKTIATVMQRMINTCVQQAQAVEANLAPGAMDENQLAGLHFLTTSTFTFNP